MRHKSWAPQLTYPVGRTCQNSRVSIDDRHRPAAVTGEHVLGRVVSFDVMKGYGFIARDGGGEDTFFHVKHLLGPSSSVYVGCPVAYVEQRGERGLQAHQVQSLAPGGEAVERPAAPTTPHRRLPVAEDAEIMTRDEFIAEITEVLLESAPEITAGTLIKLRDALATFSIDCGWVNE